MSHTIRITKLQDGPRNALFHVYIEGDGVADDVSNAVLIDPVYDFSPGLASKPVLTVMELAHSFSGFSATLQFDYLKENTPLWVLTEQTAGEVCFEEFGGLKDRSSELDGSGKLLITTRGLSDGVGTLLLHVRKD